MRPILPLLLLGHSLCAQTWTQLPDFPGTARDDASAFAIGDKVYVGTGLDAGFALTSDWYVYDPASTSWSPIASLPATGRQYGASFTINGIGYLFGGTDGAALAELWAYDATADHWSQRASLPAAGRSGSVAFVLGGAAYIAAGKVAPDFAPCAELWRYDPASDSWSQRASLPGAARALACAFTAADSAYLFAGQDGNGLSLDDGWRYVATTDTWSPVINWPDAPVFDAHGSGVQDVGVVVGGALSGVPYEPVCEVFLPASDLWLSNPPTFPGPGRKGGSGAVVGNTVYFGTGTTGLERLRDWYKLEWPIGIEEADATTRYRVWPVPTQQMLHIEQGTLTTDLDAVITDVRGTVVGRQHLSGARDAIAVGTLPDGTYLLTLQSSAGRVHQRFLVAH